jgi:glycerol-3-phosphate acyltransferase PlsY
MPVADFLFVVGGYLLGSVPTAYLLARSRRGVDIRKVGSGNVGGSNLRATVGLWATVTVGLFDIAKGALPPLVAEPIGLSETTGILAGLAAVVGHDWSVWLGFQGGRGQATILGLLLIVFPAGLLWVVGFLLLGAAARQVAALHGLGVLTLPLFSVALGESTLITQMTLAMVLLMVVKRLEANERFKPYQRSVWIHRLIHDRDIY